ncbi:MAG: hypothetical protein IJV26_07225, partial [Lachnospiraceae bacterium]|nr:hypothetical protein [Lachnospiraceae bacterium]
LKDRKIDVVIANTADIDQRIITKYLSTENKTMVLLDRTEVEEEGAEIIEGDVFCIEEEKVRHDALKTSYLIFSYLMDSLPARTM